MKAIILNISAWSILPIMDGMAKYLSSEIPVLQIVWGRYFFMVLLSLPITFFFFNKYIKWSSNIQIQLIRSLFLFLSTVLFFYAISILPLADSLTLMFSAPIIVTVLSAFILREKVGLRRWIAVFLGFIGALIVIRPGFVEINLATISAIGAGFSYALYIISTRKLSSIDNPLLTLIFTGLSGAIVISLIVPFIWVSLNYTQWLLLIALASAGTIGHLLLILSLNYAEASKLAPFGYFEIVSNIIIGYVYFNDFPSIWIWLGLFIIISSGIYISLRESQTNSKVYK
tara:strand:- start:1160 stop:2017 length:858 start_codon:yes stop_codon:yes gene_type:complete